MAQRRQAHGPMVRWSARGLATLEEEPPMSRIVLTLLALCFGFTLAPRLTTVHAEAGMRCGSRLVSEGDSTYRVRQLCGDPVSAVRRVEYRSIRVPIARHPSGQGFAYGERTVEVVIDEWIYDFGPQKLVRHLTFEQDRLVNTTTGRYGIM
jgi:hypothetical protein